ncbi:MAG: hypothetical protein ACSLFE_03035 [Gemmatimonadaceae bacterium]
MARTLAAALATGLAAGCSGDAISPLAERADDDFEVMVLETVGIAEDQANGSSVVPLSARSDVLLTTCTYSSSTGRITCPDVTRNGVTISRSYALFDAANNPQERRDSSTAKINAQVWARGTVEQDAARITIDRKSDLTTTGVQPSSPARTLNGTEQGTSAIERPTTRGTARSTVVFGDTTLNLVVPHPGSDRRWPLSGTVIRSHSGTRVVDGQSGSTSISYRAVFVYDGSNAVKVTITANGVTRLCVRNLETRQQRCSP